MTKSKALNTPKAFANSSVRAPLALATDLGFGLVKQSLVDAEGNITYKHWPSMAIPADPSAMRDLSQRRRDTFDVPVGGSFYEVGTDVARAQTGNDFGREITDDFYRSPIYAALMKGALRYMNAPEIDTLVLGLPVNQYLNSDRRQFLESTFSGEIDLGKEGDKPLFCNVNRVVVRPQPLGGYLELHNHLGALNDLISATDGALQPIANEEALGALTTLVVDPGEHTLDWLLITDGQINTKASGAASDAGRHRIVRAVHEALQAKAGRPLGPSTLPRINEALRTGRPLTLAGESYDLTQFEGVIQTAVEDPITRLVEGLRGMQDLVDIIVLVGGHPDRYRAELVKRFPKIPAFVLPNSVFANVRGFQTVGEELIERAREKTLA
jgi:plasmid segregation protein ParM